MANLQSSDMFATRHMANLQSSDMFATLHMANLQVVTCLLTKANG